jgi:hypothetical protein
MEVGRMRKKSDLGFPRRPSFYIRRRPPGGKPVTPSYAPADRFQSRQAKPYAGMAGVQAGVAGSF